MVAGMVVVAVLFVAGASRQGVARSLAATAVGVAWLAVTAVAFRPGDQFEAVSAVRDYAAVMAVALLVYFRVRGRPPHRPSDPTA
jgi:hypothetical protein